MKKILLITLLIAGVAGTAFATDVSIEGNGANSQNSINVKVQTTQSVKQQNTTTINNDVDAKASTGNNTANGNSGNTTIVTGDSTVKVNISNTGNSNTAIISPACCDDPSKTPTPTTKQITPTPTPNNGSNGGNSTNNGSGSGSDNGGGSSSGNGSNGNPSNGKILGLAATNGYGLEILSSVAGTFSLAFGSYLLKKRSN